MKQGRITITIDVDETDLTAVALVLGVSRSQAQQTIRDRMQLAWKQLRRDARDIYVTHKGAQHGPEAR